MSKGRCLHEEWCRNYGCERRCRMNGIDVIMAELEDMDDDEQQEAAEVLVKWLDENGFL